VVVDRLSRELTDRGGIAMRMGLNRRSISFSRKYSKILRRLAGGGWLAVPSTTTKISIGGRANQKFANLLNGRPGLSGSDDCAYESTVKDGILPRSVPNYRRKKMCAGKSDNCGWYHSCGEKVAMCSMRELDEELHDMGTGR